VLVSSVDGVGTKLKVAFAADRHDTIGQDLVNHCVNDIAVLGAEPLFFLDYLGTGKLRPEVFQQILTGFAQACGENGCALIGGETAQMPGFYRPGEYDVSGTIVGVVDRSRMLDGVRCVRPGNVMVGLASNGLHTNGYSLARQICFKRLRLKVTSHVPELGGILGDELLKVHRSYGGVVQKLIKRFNRVPAGRAARSGSGWGVRALSHITGGGFVDNLPRVLPRDCDGFIRRGSWEIPPIFEWLAAAGKVADSEMYEVFNMGVGMIAIADAVHADAIMKFIRRTGLQAWVIGEVVKGRGRVRFG
jgi:phosphoribosylformylglycinamidine cyclo-ligase